MTEYKFKYMYIHREVEGIWLHMKKNDEKLGRIHYFHPWRCHVFEPLEDTQFSTDCLREISDFIKELDIAYNDKPKALGGDKGKE